MDDAKLEDDSMDYLWLCVLLQEIYNKQYLKNKFKYIQRVYLLGDKSKDLMQFFDLLM